MQTLLFEEIVKLQPKGLFTIPKKFRKALSLSGSDLIRVRNVKGRLILEPVRTLPYPVRSYTDTELDDFLALDKEESKKLRKKGLL